jgi:predicted NBD/HSP70 family sugar kinase
MRTGELIMNVLVIDIGGTHVKVLATGQDAHREVDSGPALTPKRMVSEARKLVADWKYDVVSIGYPGPVSGTDLFRNRGILEKDGAVSTSKRHSNVR